MSGDYLDTVAYQAGYEDGVAVGRKQTLQELQEWVRTISGNGYDEPRDPALDAVWEHIQTLKGKK